MPATATRPSNGTQHETEIEKPNHEDKPARKGNLILRSLNRTMITEPQELDFADGMMSNEFAWEKTTRQILEPLGINTEKEWLDYCKAVWKWHADKEKRETEAAADRILAEASENPLLLEILQQKIATQKKAA